MKELGKDDVIAFTLDYIDNEGYPCFEDLFMAEGEAVERANELNKQGIEVRLAIEYVNHKDIAHPFVEYRYFNLYEHV